MKKASFLVALALAGNVAAMALPVSAQDVFFDSSSIVASSNANILRGTMDGHAARDRARGRKQRRSQGTRSYRQTRSFGKSRLSKTRRSRTSYRATARTRSRSRR